MAQDESGPQVPIPISAIDDKYLLFDIQAVTWLRKHHNICGVFIGSLPQNPSQNIFMGLPMEIMPEEAQLLIELGIGYILDDARAHDMAMAKANRERRAKYAREIKEQAIQLSAEKAQEKELDKKRAMKRVKAKKAKDTEAKAEAEAGPANEHDDAQSRPQPAEDLDASESLFSPSQDQDQGSSTPTQSLSKTKTSIPPPTDLSITPTTSTFLPPTDPYISATTIAPTSAPALLPGLTPPSYTLYRHLHLAPARTFFTTPGLRFGCQFCVYPGDPLRFHSHFLAVGVSWEEEIDLMDIVGGGRLGTGVKKGWLVGGRDEARGVVRTFSIEWAAM